MTTRGGPGLSFSTSSVTGQSVPTLANAPITPWVRIAPDGTVTILFSDIEGFSLIAEKMPPDGLVLGIIRPRVDTGRYAGVVVGLVSREEGLYKRAATTYQTKLPGQEPGRSTGQRSRSFRTVTARMIFMF